MAWTRETNDYVMMRDAEAWCDEIYTDYRNRGWIAPVALEQTALDLGLTPRKARSLLEGYASRIAAELWRDMRHRFILHLENEAEYALQRAAIRTARLKEMELERAELREKRS